MAFLRDMALNPLRQEMKNRVDELLRATEVLEKALDRHTAASNALIETLRKISAELSK